LTYLSLLLRASWRVTAALWLPASLKAGVRSGGIAAATILLMVVSQGPLAAAGLMPTGSNPASSKLIAVGFGLAATLALFGLFFIGYLLFAAPFRLWLSVRPAPPERVAAPVLADEASKSLAGTVIALTERVLRHGFKRPVVADDPFYVWLSQIDSSTHPIWVVPDALQARRDFVHSTAVLAQTNSEHGPREDVEYWREVVTDSSQRLVQHLLPGAKPSPSS
jgi:hypothetical protein